MHTHFFHPSIIRAYDIRGIIDETLFDKDAFFLGLAFGSFLREKGKTHVIVGYDGRLSSPALKIALWDGLCEQGITVIDIGQCPTAMTYYATFEGLAEASVMITGSHNPSPYNGFKFTFETRPFFGQDLQDLGLAAEQGIQDYSGNKGEVLKKDIRSAYIERIAQDVKKDPALKIAWDAGNGVVGDFLSPLTEKLQGEHILLFAEVDGTFPNHHPDPLVEKNLIDLQKAVRTHGCDLGFAFDGDGDRVGVIDADGTIIKGDELLAILARGVLKNNPGAPIIADIKSSKSWRDEIERLGGRAIYWRSGHATVKAKMLELKAPLAGEFSGHIFFKDGFYGYDDGLYAAIRLLSLMGETGLSLKDLKKPLTFYHNTPEYRITVAEEEKFQTLERAVEYLKNKQGFDVILVDGIRLENEKGWALIRASGTENALTARIETLDKKDISFFKDLLLEALIHSGLKKEDIKDAIDY